MSHVQQRGQTAQRKSPTYTLPLPIAPCQAHSHPSRMPQMILDVLVSHGLTPAATHGW
jgi:hypothetical protein